MIAYSLFHIPTILLNRRSVMPILYKDFRNELLKWLWRFQFFLKKEKLKVQMPHRSSTDAIHYFSTGLSNPRGHFIGMQTVTKRGGCMHVRGYHKKELRARRCCHIIVKWSPSFDVFTIRFITIFHF